MSPRSIRVFLWIALCGATLVAVLWVAFNWRARLAWTRMHRELAAAGERVDLAAFVPPAVPDEQNFAMTPFLAPLFRFEPGTQAWRETNAANRAVGFGRAFPNSPAKTDGWATGQPTDLAAWAALLTSSETPSDAQAGARAVLAALEVYDPVLTEFREASRRPHARFNIRYDHPDPSSIVLPHLAVLRRATQILSLRASARLALGEPDPALDDLLLAQYLADVSKDEPLLISYLVRCAQQTPLTQAVWDGLAQRRWAEPQLARLQRALQDHPLWSGVALATKGECAFGHQIITMVRGNPSLLTQLGSGSTGSVGPAPPTWLERQLLRLIPSGWFYFEAVEYDRLFRESMLSGAEVAKGHLDPGAVASSTARLEEELRPGKAFLHRRFMSGMLLPALPRVYEKAARSQTLVDLAATACALERYRLARGECPGSLQDLVPQFLERVPTDTIKGGPLGYRRGERGGFLLYSIGWNGVDDGGVPGLTAKGKTDLHQGDWVWRSPE